MREDRHGNALPHRMQVKGGAYYHVRREGGRPRWRALGTDYAEALRRWAELEGGGLRATTLSEVAAAYSADATDGLLRLGHHGRRSYKAALKALLPVFGHLPLADIRPQDVAEYRRRRTAARAANREMMLLGLLYRYARAQGWWESTESPADAVRRNPMRARERTATEGEIAALLVAASPLWQCIIDFALCTGWRSTEIRTMRRSQVMEKGVRAARLKGGLPAVVRWSDTLRAAVDGALALQPKQRPSVYVFAQRSGQPYQYAGWDSAWRRLRAKAGCPDLTFHDLRRTAATLCTDLEHARRLLGHSDPAMTGRVYLQVLEVPPAR